MRKKKFNVIHEPTGGSILVEIDFEYKITLADETRDLLSLVGEMVRFWSGWQDRVRENEGDFLRAFLKQLCREALAVQLEYNYTTSGVISEMSKMEGWCNLDGSSGIKLLSVDAMELSDQSDYEVTELSYDSVRNN